MRILVVEDDKALRHSLEATLHEAGFEARCIDSGEQALRLESSEVFDAAILDIGLPDIDGFEVLRTLRLQGSSTPVLMLTARDALSDRVAGLDLGADDYLVKPFAPSELVARLRAIVRRRQGQAAGAVVVGTLFCDWRTGRAHVNDRDLALRPREWAALRVLASRPGQVVDRDLLAAEVFPQDEAPSLNALEIHVGRLRRKLQPDGPAVTNIRGRGYRLDP
ncbi:MAG: response regulator transcription factor [Alphaproteobacteria bacterium]|jgi:two-component system response regulator TctD|uniref:Two-component system response regulator TctD n=1 Tax=Brevundimonas mediterranea TaxID=74329 RepID=A0A7W6A2S4_9CAUL|nr:MULTISPECIES: response regulator transcription factor [Brevundimonas]MBU1272139.1 response regulator transcription factor [Alphaproteobacteria bacterium]MBB3872159.1 two-component system response regulator TctD [Brevundimonas mediterranea]MBU1520993.1 response regulator transcription factor [Alphaproteobacteria bacterium]MBU2031266.1 response regulator transcription factor [Alphaproteobacteria bacterium]MBU2163294.1 response regulator transcription factor [Alphaproteobacteria bacterium]